MKQAKMLSVKSVLNVVLPALLIALLFVTPFIVSDHQCPLKIKVQLNMTIIKDTIKYICSFKEFSDGCFVKKRHAKDAEYNKCTAIKAKIMFNNGDKTICCDRRVNLDSDSIFSNTPVGFYVQMLLNPFKEQFYLPSIFIKQSNMFRFNLKIISKVSECSPDAL